MQRFHNLGLIEANRDPFLIIKENKLTAYLAQDRLRAAAGEPVRVRIFFKLVQY
jgi:hypothetical protein